ncbi:hypothetical protein P7K49_015669 [Saguinus oedipus]|uniref:Uncharacterized protein n=1 Tax=Saguinus oedipus TaxID=9490 RepID=A0ABQ9VAP9_SAGOE|nr:hypothetical protein P7K49_015669 [Saguinus oedipus]
MNQRFPDPPGHPRAPSVPRPPPACGRGHSLPALQRDLLPKSPFGPRLPWKGQRRRAPSRSLVPPLRPDWPAQAINARAKPRPRRACVSCVFGARAGCAPSAFAPPAPEARLLPPHPSPRQASRANMGQEEELLRIAKKLEKMAAEFGSRPPPPGGAGEPGSPRAQMGLGDPREARLVQGPRPFEDPCWAPRGRRGIMRVLEARLVHVPLDM